MGLAGYLPAIAAVLVAACAIAASAGFRGRTTVVGIDLGTTYSVVGVIEDGRVRIINGPNGSPLLPSMVSFLDGGAVAVGHAALERLAVDPAHTIYQAKRFIGRDLADEAVMTEAAAHHFELVHRPGDVSEAWFRVDKIGHEAAVSPEVVGSHVLRGLLSMVAADLGHEQVATAVIAVPAKFSARQRQATADAFRLAGLKVLRVLEEPTAAALAYGLHRQPHVHHILVYDFGGGTLDVSLLFVNDGSVEVMSSEGDDHLGGSDFDQLLAKHLEGLLGKRILATTATTATAPEAREGTSATTGEAAAATAAATAATAECNFAAPLCTLPMLYPLAERAKRELSAADATTVTCMTQARAAAAAPLRGAGGIVADSNGDGAAGISASCAQWEPVTVRISRADFERVCAPLFARALAPVDRLLTQLSLSKADVDEVVCVGGTTRMPKVRELLQERLGVERLNTHIDPDVTVAWGAASVAH